MMTRLLWVLALMAVARPAWAKSPNNRHVRPSVRVFPADYVALMAQNRTQRKPPVSTMMPFPRKSKPVALPQMSNKFAKFPPPHPHNIKEMPRSQVKPGSSQGKQMSPNNPISKIINSHHELGGPGPSGMTTSSSSKSSTGQSIRPPSAQPYSFDDYYYYDYDYDYEPKSKRPKLVTKAAPPKRKTPSNLYSPTYKRAPSPPRPSYRRPVSHTYRKRPSSSKPDTRIVKKSGQRSSGRPDHNSRGRIGNLTPTVQSSPSSRYEQTNSRSSDYYYDDDEYYYDDYEPARRRSESRSSSYGGGSSGLNPLALLVAPLAGISLLTAAAAVALNPVLVSISITGKKRRRRRSVFGEDLSAHNNSSQMDPEVKEKIHEMEVLEKFLVSVPSQVKYQQQILSMYLSCSGYLEDSNLCLDRVFCEYADPHSSLQDDERDVVAIVLFNIMGNDLLGQDYKDRLRQSAQVGRENGKNCHIKYPCNELDHQPTAAISKSPKSF